ncbi:mitogen-activated protein kinase kinase kinase 18 [Vigna radiata var. radiata]|uniref:mitogen-activated protein kinase kinase kinase n=1 Tax=Vigna radiata var. radiata TaxID=3916 RepID=A0A1S3TIR1_VIGRR|nr:mitogen-activated protein kinase kinase kinase 18 [Vigna radiata var. radiata]
MGWWQRGHTIGRGSSATVSTATCCAGGAVFAVKSAELSRSESLKREQKILSSVSSPYVVAYKGCDVTMENNKLLFNLFMEHMPFGTVAQATCRHGGRLEEVAMARYTRQIVQGLEYLHSKELVHCDIKGANILIGEDGVKIGDLGCAKSVVDSTVVIGGTPMFMAPEVARGEEQGCASDIWSLGCTVVEMATGDAPWPNVEDPFSVLYHIAYSGEVPEIPCFLSEEAKDFLGKCLRRNPQERWNASELLKHPFIGKSCSNNKEVLESNSSSPTSVLEPCFWSSVEESESVGDLINNPRKFELLAAGRVRMLALSSGLPCWAQHDDENWITARGNGGKGFGNGGSGTASASHELSH